MTVASSLFAPASGAVLPAASDWITGTLFGGLATGLCVLAIALVALLLMTGRVAIREGLRVAIGCFVLLGAPIIAGGLRGAAHETVSAGSPQAVAIETAPPPAPPPTANYDPYAGASLRSD